MLKRLFIVFCLFVGALCGVSCSYSMGGRGKLPFSTIMVAPVKNMTDLAQTQATLARNIIDSLNVEEGLKVVPYNGQAELTVVIAEVKRTVSLTSSRDTDVASTITMSLKLNCSLRDMRTGKYYFENRSVSVSSENYMGGQAGLLETQVFPQLARDAARKIKDTIVGTW
jgi:hypothetical protein